MSSNVCRTCKHEGSCTYPRNQVIVQCEEYEYAKPRQAQAAQPSTSGPAPSGASDKKRESAATAA